MTTTCWQPAWVRDAVFYQIFPDRWARSDGPERPHGLERWEDPPTRRGFKGGDLPGIVANLDYLSELGITALYLNPIFKSGANHRYHTYDYYEVDPLLGGNAALRQLLDEAHARGMKVILDGVFNHVGRGFYQFHHVMENGASSPYVDWFTFNAFPVNAYDETALPNYSAWWRLHGLPKLNVNNPDVRAMLWDVAEHWIKFGVDGWRLDVPEEIDDAEFWREFRRRVKRANPDAYLVGEVWHPAPEWLEGDRFDGLMNYPLTALILGFFLEETIDPSLADGLGYGPVPRLTLAEFGAGIDKLLAVYPLGTADNLLTVLDTHDTPRFLTMSKNDDSAYRMAIFFQMTFPGVPCLYYGDEIGMVGGADPDCRRAFPWDEALWNTELRDHVRRCIALRHAHRALRWGDYRGLYASDGVYVFARQLGDETMLIALNVSRERKRVLVPVAGVLEGVTRLRNVWSNDTVSVSGGMVSVLDLVPRSGAAWSAERAKHLN